MTAFLSDLGARLDDIHTNGLWKTEEALTTPQRAHVRIGGRDAINLCANNYLGLADHPALIAAAKTALDDFGFGMASVRFICGTQDLHRQLEQRLARWLGHDDAILFAACFDANGGLFEPLLGPEDAVISDALNHASIIDGIRLCKARRYRYATSDMDDLERQLKLARADGARHVMVATDGVFSMDGTLANLPIIRALADRHGAMVMVDDCHAAGLIGHKGAGTPAHFGVRADIVTGTLGKALGGGIGGYVAGPRAVVDLLRQRSRPYLFSNALPPMVVAASLMAIDLVENGEPLRDLLARNSRHWRAGLERSGLTLISGHHPIVPVMTGDAFRAQAMAARLLELGVLVKGFVFPVVPQGKARIRTQMNASLTIEDLDCALAAFETAGRETGLLP
ncbi:MAG: glycine C-acetyltransferase [Tabrizicola sp.]|nr:glycine C-acetyltransferase [Tabrizicola sp.]